MIPFNGPPLGDSVPKACNPTGSLMPQVRVLRRPQPVAVDALQPSTSRSIAHDNKIDTTTTIAMKPKIGAINEPGYNNEDSILFSEDQWPSLADTMNNSSRSQASTSNTTASKDSELRQAMQPNRSPKIISRNNNNNMNENPQQQRPQETSSSSSNGDLNKRHPLLKSYKERADEYAKARLRILGSAFSEDENPGDKTPKQPN